MLADDTEALFVRVPDDETEPPRLPSACRSTPATSSSAGCGCCGAASTAGRRRAGTSTSFFDRVAERSKVVAVDDAEVTFAVLDVAPEPYAVTPMLTARVGIAAIGDDPVHAIALRCQVRIEPLRRDYTDDEAAGL